jgi:membrane AbrB-like protein
MPIASSARIALMLAIGIAGAAAASWLGTPLPFLIGPLIACGCATMAGVMPAALPYGREAGQLVVGLAIGFRFVPAILDVVVKLLPAMLITTLVVIAITMVAALALRRIAKVDDKTAFLATAAAGLAEMVTVAHRQGANADAVAVVHVVRLTSVVLIVPVLVTLIGEDGGIVTMPITFTGEALGLAVVSGIAAFAAFLVRQRRIPNSWVLVPVAIAAIASGSGFGPYAMPALLLKAAQILIGVWLGCRFRRELLTRLPRVTFAAVVTSTFLIAAAAGGAFLLSSFTGLSFATSLLAVAPAGITEMVLTATAMHLDPTGVTAFHLMRIAIITTTILATLKAFEALTKRL